MATFEADWRAGVHSHGDPDLRPGMYVTAEVAATSYAGRNAAVTALREALAPVDGIQHAGYGSLPVGIVLGTPKREMTARQLLGAVYAAAPGDVWRASLGIHSAAPDISPTRAAIGAAVTSAVEAPGRALDALADAVGGFGLPTWIKGLLSIVVIGALVVAGIYVTIVLPTALRALGGVAKGVVS